jgi:hypothetical protein
MTTQIQIFPSCSTGTTILAPMTGTITATTSYQVVQMNNSICYNEWLTDAYTTQKIKQTTNDWYNTCNTCDSTSTGFITSSAIFEKYLIKILSRNSWIDCPSSVKTEAEKTNDAVAKIKQIIEHRQAPLIITPRRVELQPLPETTDFRELRARELIRRILGERQYRNLQEKGFVAIKAQSGKTYILKPGYAMTAVYEHGQKVASLCIQLKGEFPPCDALAMRAMLLWNNEAEFWNRANRSLYQASDNLRLKPNPLHEKTLVQHFREVKQTAGLKKLIA